MAAITWVLPRYPIPLIPALAILAADAGVALVLVRLSAWARGLVVAGLVVMPLVRIIEYDILAARLREVGPGEFVRGKNLKGW
jgi:hypothetical protein